MGDQTNDKWGALGTVLAVGALSGVPLPVPHLPTKRQCRVLPSMTQRLARAATVAELDALLAQCTAYPRADAKSRRTWARVAESRRAELGPAAQP